VQVTIHAMPGKANIEELNEGARLLLQYHRAWMMRWYLWGIVFSVATDSMYHQWPSWPEHRNAIILLLICGAWLLYAGYRVYDISSQQRSIISGLCVITIGFACWLCSMLDPNSLWDAYPLLAVLLSAYPLYFTIAQLRRADDAQLRARALEAAMERSRVSLDAAEANSGWLTLIQTGVLGSRFYCLRQDEDAVAVMVFNDSLPSDGTTLHEIFWVWRSDVALSLNENHKVTGTIGARKIKGKLIRDDAKLVNLEVQPSLGTAAQ
jgi:hypothetical protein